jgi:SAM-dependent methyltransferase
MPEAAGGSATRWGPLFGARAAAWAETWEGPAGWGTPVYEHVLERAEVGLGSRVLDCGCGAGRFARMAADRGASVAGIDAANELIEIAAERVPEGDFRAGDIEALPWEDDSFDLVTGFSAFQFADDKVRALREARRVSRGSVAAVIPTRVPESGIAAVFKPVSPLFAEDALASLKESGMFALSEPGKLDAVLAAADLAPSDDEEIECPIVFEGVGAACLPSWEQGRHSSRSRTRPRRPSWRPSVPRLGRSPMPTVGCSFRPGTARCSLTPDPRRRLARQCGLGGPTLHVVPHNRRAAGQNLRKREERMRVLLSTYGSRGDVEPMVGLAVQLRALGVEGCDALVATGVTAAGVWR